MARITTTFTVSMPPEMAEEMQRAMKREHRTRSELTREALRRYLAETERSRDSDSPNRLVLY